MMYEVVHRERLLMRVFHRLSENKRKGLEISDDWIIPYLIWFVLYPLIDNE